MKMMMTMAILVAASLVAAAQSSKPAAFVRYDLNGEWQAEFHNPGSVDVEKIMVVDYGNGLVATKFAEQQRQGRQVPQ